MHKLTNRDTDAMTATCAECGPVHIIRNGVKASGTQRYACGVKQATKSKERYVPKQRELKEPTGRWRYDYPRYKPVRETISTIQGHKCAICETPFSELKYQPHMDHDHETDRLRGLLCSNCNRGIGFLKDDVEIVRSALKYLESKGALVYAD